MKLLNRPFLTARWVNLGVFSYAVDPVMLEPFLPPGCSLDLRDGSAYCSLVAFDFLDARVLGVAWPGYRNFPEVNLRFYVRHGEQRGVCFVHELVPFRLVVAVASLFYNEAFRHARMSSRLIEDEQTVQLVHRLALEGSENHLSIVATKPAYRPEVTSREHFLIGQEWGFGNSRGGALRRFRVVRPVWDIWPVKSFELNWNWERLYGKRWAFLAGCHPTSVILVCGSAVSVYPTAAVDNN